MDRSDCHKRDAPAKPTTEPIEEPGTSAKLAEVPASKRQTRTVAAIGTGYSGTTLDRVDKVRTVAEDGVIVRGKEKLPAPEEVREIARAALDASIRAADGARFCLWGDAVSVGSVTLQIVTGLVSGLAGSFIGAYAQRWQYKQQKREEHHGALWQYQQALQDVGDYLTYPTYYGGAERYRKPEPEELINTRNRACVAIPQLPAKLRDDLIKEDDSLSDQFHTLFEYGDHLGWLARRLRSHLMEPQGLRTRWASRARRVLASITPARKPVEVSSDTP